MDSMDAYLCPSRAIGTISASTPSRMGLYLCFAFCFETCFTFCNHCFAPWKWSSLFQMCRRDIVTFSRFYVPFGLASKPKRMERGLGPLQQGKASRASHCWGVLPGSWIRINHVLLCVRFFLRYFLKNEQVSKAANVLSPHMHLLFGGRRQWARCLRKTQTVSCLILASRSISVKATKLAKSHVVTLLLVASSSYSSSMARSP